MRMDTHKSPMRAQRTGMHGLQHTVLLSIDTCNALPGRRSPCEKDHPVGADTRDKIDGFLGKSLPPFIGVTVRLVRAHSEAGIQHQDTTISPRREKTTIVRGRLERRVTLFDSTVNVHQRRRSSGWRTNGECQTMGLVVVVVRVLTDDDSFDCMQRCMA